MQTNRIVIPSTVRTIFIEEYDLEFKDDIMDLAVSFSLQKEKNHAGVTDNSVLANALANFLNTRWVDHLNGRVLSPSDAFKIMKPIMGAVNELKKNIDESVK